MPILKLIASAFPMAFLSARLPSPHLLSPSLLPRFGVDWTLPGILGYCTRASQTNLEVIKDLERNVKTGQSELQNSLSEIESQKAKL